MNKSKERQCQVNEKRNKPQDRFLCNNKIECQKIKKKRNCAIAQIVGDVDKWRGQQ